MQFHTNMIWWNRCNIYWNSHKLQLLYQVQICISNRYFSITRMIEMIRNVEILRIQLWNWAQQLKDNWNNFTQQQERIEKNSRKWERSFDALDKSWLDIDIFSVIYKTESILALSFINRPSFAPAGVMCDDGCCSASAISITWHLAHPSYLKTPAHTHTSKLMHSDCDENWLLL